MRPPFRRNQRLHSGYRRNFLQPNPRQLHGRQPKSRRMGCAYTRKLHVIDPAPEERHSVLPRQSMRRIQRARGMISRHARPLRQLQEGRVNLIAPLAIAVAADALVRLGCALRYRPLRALALPPRPSTAHFTLILIRRCRPPRKGAAPHRPERESICRRARCEHCAR
jgi:hypothetical protein